MCFLFKPKIFAKAFWILLSFFGAVSLAQTVPPLPDPCKEAVEGSLKNRPKSPTQKPSLDTPLDLGPGSDPEIIMREFKPEEIKDLPGSFSDLIADPESKSWQKAEKIYSEISKLSLVEIRNLPDKFIDFFNEFAMMIRIDSDSINNGKLIQKGTTYLKGMNFQDLGKMRSYMRALNSAQRTAWISRVSKHMLIHYGLQLPPRIVQGMPPVIISDLFQHIPEHLIPYLKKKQIQAISPLDISSSSLDQMRAFTEKQIGYFSAEQITAFSEKWFQSSPIALVLTVLQIQGLSAKQINILLQERRDDLSLQQIRELEIQRAEKLTEQEISAIDPKDIPDIAPWELGALTLEQGGFFRQEQVSAFTEEQIPFLKPELAWILTPSQIPRLSRKQIRALRGEALSRLRIDQIQAFTEEQISLFRADQWEILIAKLLPVESSWGFFSHLTATQLRHLSLETAQKLYTLANATENTEVLSLEQREVLENMLREEASPTESAAPEAYTPPSPEQIPNMPEEWVANLKPSQIESLSESHIQALTEGHVRIFSPQQFFYFSGKKLKFFHSEQMAWLGLEIIRALSLKHIHALTGEQIAGFTIEQTRAFTTDQMSVFSLDQTAGFRAEQWEALLDAQLRVFGEEHIRSISMDVLKLLSSEWLKRLSPAQFKAFSEGQISALNAEQLVDSDKIPLLTPEQTGALPLDLIWVLNPDQISQLKEKQIRSLAETHLQDLTADQVKGFTLEQIKLFETEALVVLIVWHAPHLSALQMGAFSLSALKGLPPEIKAKLQDEINKRAIANGLQILNQEQRTAIGIL